MKTWDEVREELYTEEEIAQSNERVRKMKEDIDNGIVKFSIDGIAHFTIDQSFICNNNNVSDMMKSDDLDLIKLAKTLASHNMSTTLSNKISQTIIDLFEHTYIEGISVNISNFNMEYNKDNDCININFNADTNLQLVIFHPYNILEIPEEQRKERIFDVIINTIIEELKACGNDDIYTLSISDINTEITSMEYEVILKESSN